MLWSEFPIAPSYPHHRGTSLIKKRIPLGLYSRTMPRAVWGWALLMSEVPLYPYHTARMLGSHVASPVEGSSPQQRVQIILQGGGSR